MGRRAWAWLRLIAGAAILGVIVWRLGTGPIVDGISRVTLSSVGIACAICAATTAAAAYRWTIVADGLGVGIPLRSAMAAYYRSQFLNTALPGGILGDAHRAVRHGQDVGDVNRAARAVAWERSSGQVVQGALALIVLAAFASPFRHDLPIAFAVVAAATIVLVLIAVVVPGRFGRAVRSDIRDGLWAHGRWHRIIGTSTLVVAGHTATFLIAARTAGTDASVATLLPLAMLVLLAMAVPTNIGGWGPREGAAAWAFGAAGLGAAQGVAAATVYGVLVLIASLPGAVVLVIARRRRSTVRSQGQPAPARQPVGAVRG